ncbi:restriction endonuclease subunit S [Arthrobacter sp. AD-310]
MPQNIGDNVIHSDGIARIQESDAQRLSKYRMRKGDIVYSRRGDVEKRALVRDANEGWLCGTGCLRVRLGDTSTHDPAFISYLLGTEESRAWIVRHAVGATMPNLNTSILSAVPLEVPEPAVQRAIAEVLGAFDDKIAVNTKVTASTAELATSLFSHAYQNADRTFSLSDLVSTQYGVTTSAHGEPGPKFLRVTDINKKPWIEWDTTPNCTVSDLELSKYRVSAGDILVARMADPGKAAFIDPGDPEAVFASYLVRLKPHDPAQALYLYYFLRSPQYLEYAEGAMSGSVQKNMNAKVIVAADIALPGSALINRFSEAVRPLRSLIQSYLNENRTLVATRDALLPQLMSGKLRVKDAEKVLEEAGV